MLALEKNKLNDFLNIVSKDMPVFAPIKENNSTNFCTFSSHCAVDTITLKTNKSPKNLFFACYENIVKFNLDGKNISIEEIEKYNNPFLLFGIRSCDYKSLEILDKIFLQEPIDAYYEERRKNCIIITLACNTFDTTCFCTNFSITPFSPNGDIACFEIDNYYCFDAKTQKGKLFLNKYTNLFINIDFNITEYKENLSTKFSYLPLKNLNLKYFLDNNMLDIFNNQKWDSLSKTCLGCGSCTFFCPTCSCYDIGDYKNGNSITRYRCWDSCMYKDFTIVAGGGNPRKTQKERFRQRFMHKLVYFPSNNNNLFGCVGCGRCLKICPNSLNIVKVIKNIGE